MKRLSFVVSAGLCLCPLPLLAQQDAQGLVRQAVHAQLALNQADHSHWLFHEDDKQPEKSTTEWVAETESGDVKRIVMRDGKPVPVEEQRSKVDAFIHDRSAQEKQRRDGAKDDKQEMEMMLQLPDSFIWTITGHGKGQTMLHFRPDPAFHPPSMQARVFAAMEGNMTIDDAQHRIVVLEGRLIEDVVFGFGLARLHKGGTFAIRQEQVAPGHWELTTTHVHILGNALFFKSISQQEDNVRGGFEPLSATVTLSQAGQAVMAKPAGPIVNAGAKQAAAAGSQVAAR